MIAHVPLTTQPTLRVCKTINLIHARKGGLFAPHITIAAAARALSILCGDQINGNGCRAVRALIKNRLK